MTRLRVMASWLGHTDLRASAQNQPIAIREKIEKIAGALPAPSDGIGPVKSLLQHQPFDKVLLISNYPNDVTEAYLSWLGTPATLVPVMLNDPTDYGEIFTTVDDAMRKFLSALKGFAVDLAILLSPGTPAMAAVWVLLGKSKYPATFYQTFKGDARETRIPFDLAVDVVPELLHGADSLMHQLASKSPQEVEGFEPIVGNSSAIRIAVGRARKAAVRDVPVLLLGESGTGKEMFARAIHAASWRKNGMFVPVNCAAIPRELIESELFGHVRGAFTGAERAKAGAFKQADSGILFLDEIGELAPEVQAKLLRVLQPPFGSAPCVCEYQPVGAMKTERANVRVIAATNRNIITAISDGQFREDLYFRLAVITVKLPTLRDRRSDLPLLAKVILEQINKDFEAQEPGYKHKSLCASAISFVKHYDWPGNVRQLSNVLLQAAVMSDGVTLGQSDLEAAVTDLPASKASQNAMEVPFGEGFNIVEHLESIHRHYLARAMREAGGVKTKAASLLGLKNYQTLDAQLKRLGVNFDKDGGGMRLAR